MKKTDLYKFIEKRVMLLDGATGTELQKIGMPQQECPELWATKNQDRLIEVQSNYISAGSDVIYTCTFGANPFKLAEFGHAENCVKMNSTLARISRKAAQTNVLVAGNIGPTGLFIEPFGNLPFDDAVNAFKKQVRGLEDGGVDIFIIETMMDIQEARAALIAVKETTDIPVMVSMTFSDDGKTLTGTCPLAALVTLQSLGADAVGCNCSVGPDAMLKIIGEMKSAAKVPLLAKPNAGLPKLIDGKTVFDMSAADFASYGPEFIKAGCNILGGCCGTNPEFIRNLKQSVQNMKPARIKSPCDSALSSSRKAVFIGKNRPLAIIGERINPTGKQTMKDELKEGKFKEIRRLAVEQKEMGADVLDVNVGAPGVDESTALPEAVKILSSLVDTPLCLDSSNIEAIERALRIYPGRALINSISFEKHKIKKLLPAAAKYGAMFILLPLGDDEIPETAENRIIYVNKIMKAAAKQGFSKEDIMIDGLVMTVSSNQSAAIETLKLIEWAGENSFNTVAGLSNVSFGLPERKWINSAFLAMAAGRGLTCAISNPANEELINIKLATDIVNLRDRGCKNYIARFQHSASKKEEQGPKREMTPELLVYESVVKGDREHIRQMVADVLAKGLPAGRIVDEILIPAINKVGDLFDKKEYYLPQLIMSAETMKAAFDLLEPLLMKDRAPGEIVKKKTKIVLATVKGDIHDIGKNIVALMMKNYGFEIVDLGKDVGHEKIIEAVRTSGAGIVGLSALMTTTMANMKDIICECRNSGLEDVKFIVGGAVVDQSYADLIGADGYAPDSVEAVKLVRKLSENQ